MDVQDSAGYRVSGGNVDALTAFENACREFRCLINDPVASVERAIEAGPAMTMGYALKAWLHLLGTEPAGLPVARDCLQTARRLPSTERERGHLEAINLVCEGNWRAAGRRLEDVSAAYPRDGLALQAGHQIDFFTGDSRMLRDRIARALPHWSTSSTGYHALLGMYAFGLEECGDYQHAQEAGRRAVELERRDTWAWHAVAHVMEMQNRTAEGIDWLRTGVDSWSQESFFAIHNWWHLALFHLDRGDFEEVLRLYDGPIYGSRSPLVLDMIDASALLWRLSLLGVDVGDRWGGLAERWEPVATAGNYAFNAWHGMMAFVGAERSGAQQAVIDSLRTAAAGHDDAAAFAREIGLDATLAVQAFGRGRYAEALRLLRPLRSYASRFGGSHAQRDLIDLTMIESATRAGDSHLAGALAAERAARRPASPLSQLFQQRARATQKPAEARPEFA